jgi:hypothetical protein
MKQPTKPAKETAVYDPPAIADAIPLEAGVERQSDFSRHVQLVYDAPDWSVATLLSWVIWRDQNRICKISHYSDWRATVRYGAEDGMNAMAAWRMVLMALKNGELVAIEDGVPLAAEHWYGVKANSKSASTVFRRNMHFGRESILNHQQLGITPTKVKRKVVKIADAEKAYSEYINSLPKGFQPTLVGFETFAKHNNLRGGRNRLRTLFHIKHPGLKRGRPNKSPN